MPNEIAGLSGFIEQLFGADRQVPRRRSERLRTVRPYSLSSVGAERKGRIASDPALLNLPPPLMWLHRNMLAIALANKLARIAWAVLARGRSYQPRIVAI